MEGKFMETMKKAMTIAAVIAVVFFAGCGLSHSNDSELTVSPETPSASIESSVPMLGGVTDISYHLDDSGNLVINWSKVTNATGYMVELETVDKTSDTQYLVESGDTTSITITPPSGTYRLRVQAINKSPEIYQSGPSIEYGESIQYTAPSK